MQLSGQAIEQVVTTGAGAGIHLGITPLGAGMTLGTIPGITAAGAGGGMIPGTMAMQVGTTPGTTEAIGAGAIHITVLS